MLTVNERETEVVTNHWCEANRKSDPVPGSRLRACLPISAGWLSATREHIWGPDDEDSVWQSAIDVWLLNSGNAYDALASLFGIRNNFGFRPLAVDRGLPKDTSKGVRDKYAATGGPDDVYGTAWITRVELASAGGRRPSAPPR